MTVVFAKELRIPERLKEVPGDKPGWYKWWATNKTLELLLNSQYIQGKFLSDLQPYLAKQNWGREVYYQIYVGVAIKESIRDRVNWHINQRHTESCVKHGTLSTLRQTVSSLVAGCQRGVRAENATNDLIDSLMIEYFAIDHPIKSSEAEKTVLQIEQNEVDNRDYLLPLNIRDNKHPIVQEFRAELKKARSSSKRCLG